MNLSFEFLSLLASFIGRGIGVTILVSGLATALSLAISYLAGTASAEGNLVVRTASRAYIEFFRGTSLVVQLFWLYFVLPFAGITLSPLFAGVVAIGLNTGAYGAEAVRGAIRAVGREQREACTALNLSGWSRLRLVLLPQATRLAIPSLANNTVELIKGSSIVSMISLNEITFQAMTLRVQTGQTALPFLTILAIYLVLSLGVDRVARALERRIGAS